MSIKSKIRRALFMSPKGELLFYKMRVFREKKALKHLSDMEYITKKYKERFGREINLADPQNYTEKL